MSGLVGSSQYFFGDTGFYGYEIGQSCRFDSASSEYLTRTPSGAGNRKVYTLSAWVKIAKMGDFSLTLLAAGVNGDADERTNIIVADHKFLFQNEVGGARVLKSTTALLRDVGQWYHLVMGISMAESSNDDKVKMYINGVQQSDWGLNGTFPDVNTYINSTEINRISSDGHQVANHFDGYIAEMHLVDGQQLAASSFGETKEGVWVPKAYTGSYGTNGFYMKFDQTGTGTASASTIGADSSGNNNHFTSTNLSANDSNIPDSPTNNFATFNSIYNHTGGSLSEGNLKVATGTSEYGPALSTFAQSSGKWYAEFAFTSTSGDTRIGGVRVNTALSTTYDTGNSGSFAYRQNDGDKKIDGTETSYGATWSASDIIGIALNLDNNEVTFYKNNSSQGTFSITGGEYFIALSDGDSGAGGNYLVNFGQDSSFAGAKTAQNNADQNGRGDFYYTPPSGYLALCTKNLPEPTISPLDGEQPSDYFNTVLYTGNNSGGGTQNITSLNFKPDWIWLKGRSNTRSHQLIDAVRGKTKKLTANETASEGTNANFITDFLSNGFGIGNDNGVNADSETFVAWSWLGANGTASNSDGSITSTVSANTTAGFSIVSYTGTGSSTTVGHGLGSVPDLLIIKRRNSAREWYVWNSVSAGTGYLYLNDTAALNTDANRNDRIGNGSSYVAPTASLITLGTSGDVNGSSDTYIMYCFRSIEGYSKIGSYTGNGSTDGTFVYTGFRPAFVLVKKSSTTGSWGMFDNKRDPDNVVKGQLYANLTNAESTATEEMDFLSNGFKTRSTGSLSNDDGATVVYMAVAEMPFKYANAR